MSMPTRGPECFGSPVFDPMTRRAPRWVELDGFWSDAGTFESLYRTTRYWAEKQLTSAASLERVTHAAMEIAT